MNSRERMLCAIGGGRPDRVPLSFMIFQALAARSNGWQDCARAALEMGLDPVVYVEDALPGGGAEYSDAPGLPLHLAPGVSIRHWREVRPGARYPILHKEYVTPAGTLTCAVQQTDDWPFGDQAPFLNDYIEPRAEKFPVTSADDLPALRQLLVVPSGDELERLRPMWQAARQFAADRGLLLAAGWGVGADATAWLCGLTNAVLAAVDQPEFLDALLETIAEWNRRRMHILLEAGVDLFIRRGGYEGTSFWSPALYRRFLLPAVKTEAQLAHQAGAKFGYIMTVGALQFADLLREAGVDVVIGVDDVQDHGMDFPRMKRRAGGKLALWGGVNGFVTIEEGRDQEIRSAVRRALDALGPDGFVLSPVDNIRSSSPQVWRKVLLFIEAWKELSGGR